MRVYALLPAKDNSRLLSAPGKEGINRNLCASYCKWQPTLTLCPGKDTSGLMVMAIRVRA